MEATHTNQRPHIKVGKEAEEVGEDTTRSPLAPSTSHSDSALSLTLFIHCLDGFLMIFPAPVYLTGLCLLGFLSLLAYMSKPSDVPRGDLLLSVASLMYFPICFSALMSISMLGVSYA